jgi:hypothetical protein
VALFAIVCGWTNAAAAFAGTSKVVRYRGFRLVVPASWPLYDLSSDPSVCVRFNRHAVYLGRPSSQQRCPAHAIGRTEAILLQPLAAAASARDAAGSGLPPVANAGAQPPQGSAAQLVVPHAGVLVTATWESRPGVIERALGTRLPASTASAAASAPPAPPSRARAASAAAGSIFNGLGFDACSAPSAAQMEAWSESSYRAVGVYIGGTNMACAQPNLTASWVNAESAAGWHLIPTYVGLQAPSNGCSCAAINSGRASAEGAAAAGDAVKRALAIGIGPGNPIYFDMENYSRGGGNTSAVLTFLAAWTAGLHAAGYQSGVYSNAFGGLGDLVAARGSGFNEPDDIWIADWNGQRTVASPYVPGGEWSNHRIHQYDGGHNETHGGVTINIDGNFLDGATATSSAAAAAAAFPDGTYLQIEGSEAIYEVVGGAPLFVSPEYRSTLSAPKLTPISQQQFALLNKVPVDGTLVEDSTGALYRVAGGAPLLVSNPSLFEGIQPVQIDHWNIANAGNPAAHLNGFPANGTFLRTTSGGIYRVAGGAPFAITSWGPLGGFRPSVTIDQWDLSNLSNPAAHLSATPRSGTVVEGLPSRTYWAFAGGTRRLAYTRSAAVQVSDSGLAAFSAMPCVVPHLQHLTLHQAKGALRRADCGLGKIDRRARRSTVSHVITQVARPQSTHTADFAVGLTLG